MSWRGLLALAGMFPMMLGAFILLFTGNDALIFSDNTATFLGLGLVILGYMMAVISDLKG